MKKLLCILALLLFVTSCSSENALDGEQITSIDQLSGLKVGNVVGSIYEPYMEENFSDWEITNFSNRSEMVLALRTGKISGFIVDDCTALAFISDNKELTHLEDKLLPVDTSFVFSKSKSDLKDEFNKYLAKVKEEGYLSYLKEKWVTSYNHDLKTPERTYSGTKGIINIVAGFDAPPMSYIVEDKCTGYEVELIERFCEDNGYTPNFQNTSFDSLLMGIATNKYDVGISNISYTEERAKSVDFSDPVYNSYGMVVVVNKEVLANQAASGSSDNENNTPISIKTEGSYLQLIIDGLATTCTIVFMSLLIGTVLGFVYYMICRKHIKVRKAFDILAFVVSRIPVVVILMTLFYVIFTSSSISGTVISIIGFSLITSLSVYSMLKTGVEAIDKGQTEAALALGYNENQTLFKFILPQALRIIMPSYKNEIISLIKSSSIVGYITVQDLTRVSDIVRSRTYEAFWPLLITAVLYFAMAWGLSYLADILQQKYLPNEKTKEEILKKYKQD